MSVNKLTSRRWVSITAATALAVSVAMVSGASPASAAAAKGGTLYFYTNSEQFPALDPTNMYTGRDIGLFGTYLFRTLTSYKMEAGSAGTELTADLATNTGVPSNKAKTWKYTLRPGVTWEDGSAITCADLKYGFSRAFALDVFNAGPTYAISWLDIPTLADGSSAYKGPYKKTGKAAYDKAVTCSKDNRTITYNLKRSVPDFNYFASYPTTGPIKASADTGDKYDLHPMATGPYKIKKYAINDELTLVRNDKWKKSSDPMRKAYPDDIVIKLGMNEDVRDEVDMTDQIPNGINMDGLQPLNNIAYFNDPTKAKQRWNIVDPFVTYLTANNSAGHLDCLLVRKAVFFAYDNQSLIDLSGGLKYYGVMGDNIVKPNLGMDYAPTKGNIHDPNFKIGGNPEYAKTLLEQAKTACPDAYDRATNPAKGLKYYRADTATNKKSAVLVEAALKKAGIVIETVYKPAGTYNANLVEYKSQTDFLASGWAADWANASTVIPEMWGNGCCNYTKNEKTPEYAPFIAKVNKALSELDRKKQATMWHELSQYGMDQYWYIRTVFGKDQATWGSKIGGMTEWKPFSQAIYNDLYIKQ
jgi:peptide/nickel transport system substrate-binding protein